MRWIRNALILIGGGLFVYGFLYLIPYVSLCSKDTTSDSQRPSFLTEDEYFLLDETFRDIFLRQGGVYTLFGLKPITVLDLRKIGPDEQLIDPADLTNEDRRAAKKIYKSLPQYLQKKYSYEDVLLLNLSSDALWDFWQDSWQKYTGPNFHFSFREIDDYRFMEVINLNEMRYIFHAHYAYFKERLGDDFIIEDVVQDYIHNEGPQKYAELFSSYTAGLFFGFGDKNSYLFEHHHSGEGCPMGAGGIEGSILKFYTFYPTVEALDLPHYVVFSVADPQLKRFIAGRERIIQAYRDEDFVARTLFFLDPGRHKTTISCRELFHLPAKARI